MFSEMLRFTILWLCVSCLPHPNVHDVMLTRLSSHGDEYPEPIRNQERNDLENVLTYQDGSASDEEPQQFQAEVAFSRKMKKNQENDVEVFDEDYPEENVESLQGDSSLKNSAGSEFLEGSSDERHLLKRQIMQLANHSRDSVDEFDWAIQANLFQADRPYCTRKSTPDELWNGRCNFRVYEAPKWQGGPQHSEGMCWCWRLNDPNNESGNLPPKYECENAGNIKSMRSVAYMAWIQGVSIWDLCGGNATANEIISNLTDSLNHTNGPTPNVDPSNNGQISDYPIVNTWWGVQNMKSASGIPAFTETEKKEFAKEFLQIQRQNSAPVLHCCASFSYYANGYGECPNGYFPYVNQSRTPEQTYDDDAAWSHLVS